MCLTCGCGDAHMEMGDDNITYEDVQRAAESNGNSVADTFETMQRTQQSDRQQHPDEYAGSSAS